MLDNSIVFSVFLIFTGAAVLSTMALMTRQSLLVAYMAVGMILGPWGLGWLSDSYVVQQIGDVGIIFLLFLLGLHLDPKNLLHMLKKTTLLALISSLIFAGVGFGIAYAFHFTFIESIIIGAAMMFSSTIIGLKLLPVNVIHHQHTGEVMVSVLLMQDFIAIATLLSLHGATMDGFGFYDVGLILLGFPLLIAVAYVVNRYVIFKLLKRFNRAKEYTFLVSIAWCLSLSELAGAFGLSHEIGAFIAGIAMATSPISVYIAESLKPLRDFFLVLFFFSIGASFNLNYVNQVAVPALAMASVLLLIKPLVFRWLLGRIGEKKKIAWEVGVRLAQVSEFSLLVAYIAASSGLISDAASYLVQATTMLSFLASSYIVVMNYQTPMALEDQLQKE